MITGSNIYGSYYNALLTGVNYSNQLGAAKKKSPGVDMKSMYESIFSTNGLDMQGANKLYSMKQDAGSLKKIASNLMNTSTFSKKMPASSNTDVMSVTGQATYRSSPLEMDVSVSQVAAGQKNTGAALEANARVISGEKRFEIEINGKQHQFSVQADVGDTNKALQEKMAKAINESGIGVTAGVTEDKKAGTSTLSLLATATGDTAAAKFSIRDIRGDAVKKTGADTVAQEAQNAKYTVDGAQYTSASNTVSLKSGVTATLKAAGEASVTMKADGSYAAQTIGQMADTFNGLLKKAEETDSSKLFRELSNVSKTYSKALDRLGIQIDSKGYMSIDQAKLNTAAKDGSLEKTMTEFRNTSYGFTQRLSRVADNVNGNLAAYTNRSSFNPFFGTGLFFNMMV